MARGHEPKKEGPDRGWPQPSDHPTTHWGTRIEGTWEGSREKLKKRSSKYLQVVS